MPPAPLWERRLRAPYLHLPAWSRLVPSDRLVLISNESGSDQAWAWDRRSGSRRQVSEEPIGLMYVAITADGNRAVWFSDRTGDESGEWLAVPFEGGEPEPLLPGAGPGWPDGVALGLRKVAAVLAGRDAYHLLVSTSGGPAREIMRSDERLSIGWSDLELEGTFTGGLSTDEDLLALLVTQDGDDIHHGVRVIDPSTGEVVGELADGEGRGLLAASWSPVTGDRRLAIVHERDDRRRPGIWDLRSGERTDIELDLPGDVFPVDWWPDAGSLLLVHRLDGRDRALRFDIASGRCSELLHPVGEMHGAGVRPDGAVWYRISSGGSPSRLLDADGAEVLAPSGEPSPSGRPYRSFHFANPHGDRVHGFVVTPEGQGPFPTLMKVHGGPEWLYMDTWWPEVQAFVDHGIAVAMVNYRGSTGYGRRWRDFIIGNVGFPEVEDTLAGLDALISEGVADPERSAIGGWSWGGYVTLLALGLHPDRWACGIAGVPVGDYAASYDDSAPSLQSYDRTLLGGKVTEVPDLVRERSPITYADKVKAPVLVMIGDHDTRCPPGQALNWVEAVRSRGGDVEVYRFDAGHVSYVEDEEVRQLGANVDFLVRHLRP